jgi:hypothetical protein
MIKFLFDNFRNMPVVGNPIKVAYVGSLVKDVVKKGKESPARPELMTMGKDELEAELKNQANDMFNATISPVIAEQGIPSQLVEPLKEKGIDKIVGALREKIDAQKQVKQ